MNVDEHEVFDKDLIQRVQSQLVLRVLEFLFTDSKGPQMPLKWFVIHPPYLLGSSPFTLSQSNVFV